jgi:type VI secretion system protein ImpL
MIWLFLGAAFVLSAVWVAVWFPGMPWWVAAIVTVVVVLIVVGIVVYRKVRAARRASALERELLRQAEEQADHLRPDRRAEVRELQARMQEALRELKSSKLGGRGGNAALYALPWYVIVGPPAAGKTTALQQSELSFVAPGGRSPRLRGTAGTKNCDWWFSQDAILLDTAGRFVTHDDDEVEWLAFLDTLKQHRGKKPLDGIVVAVSVSDLVGGEQGGNVEELARQLRAKIDELQTRLDMVLPMYLVFTKADLIGGFVEFFSDLNKQQRRQVLGATFAFDDPRLNDPAIAFEDEFFELVRSVHARALTRLPDERIGGSRSRVMQFPVELSSLGPLLSRFIGELCQPNPYKDTAILRGFYFTSGTQVGRPFDRVLSGMMSGFGMEDRLGELRDGGTPQSYFVTDLFKTIIFRDRDAAIRSGSFARNRARSQIVIAGASLFGALAVVVPALASFVENQDLVRATARELDETKKARLAGGQASVARLDALLDRVRDLETAESRFSVSGLLGPWSAGLLRPAVHRLYADDLRAVVEGPLRQQITAEVIAVDRMARLDDAENFWAAYETVKLYVLMTEPEHMDPADPKGEELSKWAVQRLTDEWSRQGGGTSKPELDRVSLHTKYYVDALVKNRDWAWPKDEALLGSARRRLAEQPLERLEYSYMLRSARDAAPVRADQIFIGGSASYVTSRSAVGVPGMYTRDGWEAVKRNLSSAQGAFALEPWVLGSYGGSAQAVSADRLRDTYFDDYVRAWKNFIGGLVVSTPASVEDAIQELTVLANGDNNPYTVLFRSLATNARLDMSPASLKDKLLEGAKDMAAGAAAKLLKKDGGAPENKISPVEERLGPLIRFGAADAPRGSAPVAPTPLAQCLGELNTLAVRLGMLRESRSEPTQALSEELARTSATVERLLTGLDGATRLLVEPLLMNPIRGSRAGVATTVTSALGDKWKADVWATYDSKIAPRYPFSNGPDVALSDFVEFFRPQGGTLWGFFEKNLSDRLERSGAVFTPRPSADPAGVTGGFLQCLSHAQQITDAVFGAGAEALVPMSIKLDTGGVNIGKVKLTIDGTVLAAGNGPDQWMPAQWPGKGPGRGAVLKVEGVNFTDEVPRNGDFGFFRLLAAGGLKATRQESPTYVATFPSSRDGAPPVTLAVRPSRAVHPFASDFFSRLKCPQNIVVAGAAAP